MDINTFRGLVTLILFVAFIGVWVWAWSKRRKKDFDDLAALPLEEDSPPKGQERENV